MIVPLFVIEDGSPLNRFLRHLQVDANPARRIGRRGLHCQLDGVEQGAGVAVGHIDEVIECVGGDIHRQALVAAWGIERVPHDLPQLVLSHRSELKDAAARNERGVDGEIRILSRGPDEDDGAVLHPGEQGVLLGLVEAVHLIDEKDGSLAVQGEALLRLLDCRPYIRDAG